MPDRPAGVGTAPDGAPVLRADIAGGGARASVLSWGATLQDLRVDGIGHSVVLGGPDIGAYFGKMRYFGAVVGPLANRVAGGRLEIDGDVHQLDLNERGRTTLHGGTGGFGARNWEITEHADDRVVLGLEHPDGLSGFPGPIRAEVAYSLDGQGALTIEIAGETGRPTVFGPAFHGYWSLDGAPDLSGHLLRIEADRYLPVDENLIPTGEPAPVAGTGFDYREPRAPDMGLDHNFCLADASAPASDTLRPACTLTAGKVRLEVETTEPGLQVYTGRKIATDPHPGHGGAPYGANAGIAIEPQFWPDAPNHPGYPSPVLRPGETYRQVSRFAVSRTG